MVREQNSVLREGVIAGCIGAAVVAVWFLIFDVARGCGMALEAMDRSGMFFTTD